MSSAKLHNGHVVSRVCDATAAADFRGNGLAARAICGNTCSRDVRVMKFLSFSSVVIFAGLRILEYLVCVVPHRGAVFAAITVFSGALVFQKAFGMTALAQMG